MSNPVKDIMYYNKVNYQFSEAVYQKMATRRFGINFCCENDLVKSGIQKQLLDLNAIMNADLTVPAPPIPEPVVDCQTACLTFLGLCPTSYYNLTLILSKGQQVYTLQQYLQTQIDTVFMFVQDTEAILPCLMENEQCCDSITACRDLVTNWYNGPHFIADFSYLTLVYNTILAQLLVIEGLCTIYEAEYTAWENSGFEAAFLPNALADIEITYQNCDRESVTVGFFHQSEITFDANQEIVFTDPVLAESTYGALIDIDSFMNVHFNVVTGECGT